MSGRPYLRYLVLFIAASVLGVAGAYFTISGGALSAAETRAAGSGASPAEADDLSPGMVSSGYVSGTVREGVTNTPLEDVNVMTLGPGGTSTVTDASGAYTLNDIPAGSWNMRAWRIGYLNGNRSVSVGATGLAGIDFALTPAHSLITGTVSYSDGSPVAQQWVNAMANWPVTGASTDASGVFAISVQPGTYDLLTGRSGYTMNNAPRVTLADYQTVGGINIVLLENNATIGGLVHDQTGAPVPGASVQAKDTVTGGSVLGNVSPDASGTFTIPIAAGTWRIGANASGKPSPADQTVTVAQGQVANVDITFQVANPTIEGTVRDASNSAPIGAPIPGARVSTSGPGWNASASADSNGDYSLTVYSGTLNLMATAHAYLNGNQMVTIADGQSLSGVDFNLTPAHSTVTGAVTFAGDGPVSGQWVEASLQSQPGGGPPPYTGRGTNPSGVFTIPVTPGSWHLSVKRPGYTANASPLVTIGDYQTMGGINISLLQNNATITGRVRDQNGAPVPGGRVQGRDPVTSGKVTADAIPDATGTYTMPIAAGTWRITSTGPSGYGAPSGQTVAVSPGQVLAGVDFVFTVPNAMIHGNVHDAATNQPIPGAIVDAGSPSGRATTDASGAYSVTVSAGTSRMVVMADAHLAGYRTVTVADNQHLTGIDFSLTPAHSVVTGTARFAGDGPVVNQRISAVTYTPNGPVFNNTDTDVSGVYHLPVTPGRWHVGLFRTGYTLSTSPNVDVGDNQTVGPVDLTLLPNNAWVTGWVRDQNGAPVPGVQVIPKDPATDNLVGMEARPDASGAYTLPIAAGNWKIGLFVSGGTPPPDQEVTVSPGQTLGGVNFTVGSSAPSASLHFAPSAATAVVDTPVTVTVAITGVSNLGAFQFTLAFSPTLVNVQDITLVNDFLGSTGRVFTPLGPTVDNAGGTATFGAFSLGTTPPGPSGNGRLALVRLLPAGAGTASLQLNGIQVTDVAGDAIPASGQAGLLYIAACTGDTDGDGDIDILDVQRVAGRWNTFAGQAGYDARYDLDNDGDIDILDVQRVAGRWNTFCGG